ncbi:hypothetical protein [Desulfurivibrio alkaliphilus]|uniref:Lipoprotein n=1 Tax=Desulfurivibrio alkaliphilus (strain DSM 19089 / UNIQEM U267 / AHT2) TaxID=589865 RepID=D6Z0N3_DESAT|nr:hypothetical protein [Desulfurivibrio alkaliphilus]ADH85262.1 conserved hypothetical protein [Desulfurivibrio alkaliphilus AHT 2]
MFKQTVPFAKSYLALLACIFLLFLLAGCTQHQNAGPEDREKREAVQERRPDPYTPSGFRDLLIPAELTWLREKSMVVHTDSYAGGVLHFSGRVDVNSLTDFFTTTMRRNNWQLVGSVKYQDVMLAFTKPHKTCTIIINDRGLGRATEVQVYITDDLSKSRQGDTVAPAPVAPAAPATPFSF